MPTPARSGEARSPAPAAFDPKVLVALEGLDLKARYVMEGFLAGLHESPFHGYSSEFSEYRDYQPGDDLRHLDWQLYARSDRLCVKLYTHETNTRVYVVIDTSGSMAYRGRSAWGTKLDAARVLAAALTWFLLRQNDAVGLVALGGEGGHGLTFLRPSQKPSQLSLLLRTLEATEPSGGERLAELLGHVTRLIHRRSLVLFFSDLLEPSESIARAFKELRFLGHDCMAFQVLDGDEIEFPFGPSSEFEDLETGVRRFVNPAAARQRYLERFGSFMAGHRELFRGLEVPHCVVRTDEDPYRALMMFLAGRERMP